MIGWLLDTSVGRYAVLGLLGAGIAAIGAFYWSWTSRGAEIDRLTAANLTLSSQLDTAVEVNEGLRATLQGERDRHRRTLDRLADTERRLGARARDLDAIRRETRDAEDGPVAPVLQRTLDGLRRSAAAEDHHEGGGSSPRDPAPTR